MLLTVAAGAADDLSNAARLFNRGDYPAALALYQKRAAAPEASLEAVLDEIYAHKSAGDYRAAIAAVDRQPRFAAAPAVLFARGLVQYLSGDAEAALTTLHRAADSPAADASVWFWIGCCQEARGEAVAAQAAYQQALRHDPDMAYAHFFSGRLFFQTQEYAAAQAALEKALALDPSITDIHPLLGQVLFHRRSYEAALAMFQKIKDMDLPEAAAAEWIAKIRAAAGTKFAEQLADRRRQRLTDAAPMPVKHLPAVSGPAVRVHIVDSTALQFKASAGFAVFSADGGAQPLFSGQAQRLYGLRRDGAAVVLTAGEVRQCAAKAGLRLVPDDPAATLLVFDVQTGSGQYWANRSDRRYRGTFEARPRPADERFSLINEITLEEYLYSVLPSEMPASWPHQALRAQAIAARSKAYGQRGYHGRDGYDYCSTTHCQVYGGLNAETAATNAAVDATAGMIAVYGEKPIDAVYSNTCGGHTQWNIFSDRRYVAYWPSKPDIRAQLDYLFPLPPAQRYRWLTRIDMPVHCNNSTYSRRSNFRWLRWYTAERLSALVNRRYAVGAVQRVIIGERTLSGHVDRITFVGTAGTAHEERELPIRRLLGNLRSALFDVHTAYTPAGSPRAFIFYGGGWGHGVGMCQTGAATMAEQGNTAEQIIQFYYSGAALRQVYQ